MHGQQSIKICHPSCAEYQSKDRSPKFHPPLESSWLVMGKLLHVWKLLLVRHTSFSTIVSHMACITQSSCNLFYCHFYHMLKVFTLLLSFLHFCICTYSDHYCILYRARNKITQLSMPTHAQLQRHRLKFIKNYFKNSYMFRSSTIFRELQCPR